MTNNNSDRIAAQGFSLTFEKMCNFLAVAKTGDPHATVRGLITLCLHEFPIDQYSSASSFHTTIETLFGLAIPDSQIEAALHDLEREGVLSRSASSSYQ